LMTNHVVDYKAAIRKNPKLRIIDKPGGRGRDPYTVIASTYVNITSRFARMTFAANLKTIAAGNPGGRFPTYKQYMNAKNQMRMDLPKLPPGQVYAYREDKCDLVVLEDPAKSGKIGD